MTKKLSQDSNPNRFATLPQDYKAVGFSLQDQNNNVVNLDTPWSQEIQEKIAQGSVIIGYTLLHKSGFTLDVDENRIHPNIYDKLSDYNYEQSKLDVLSPYTISAASSAGEIVGGAFGNIVMRDNERFCIVNKLWVHQNHRKNKLGTKIMHELIQHAKNENCQSIRLETRALQAQEFYEKLGFTTVAAVASNYSSGAKDCFMLKKLGP
jgi:ribosomal protein S18 acetylase RimI-like enzyme